MLQREAVAILVGPVQKICFLTGPAISCPGSFPGGSLQDLILYVHFKKYVCLHLKKSISLCGPSRGADSGAALGL